MTIDDTTLRLTGNKQIYCFRHANLGTKPLIFVEVALMNRIAEKITDILPTSTTPSTKYQPSSHAIFYSINAVPKGLAGLSFGNQLIKQVGKRLQEQSGYVSVKHFVTLSPIPGFSAWLAKLMSSTAASQAKEDIDTIIQECAVDRTDIIAAITGTARERRRALTKKNGFKHAMLRLCAYYLIKAKKAPGSGRNNVAIAADKVADFHLRNGAKVWQINWEADTKDKRILESAGMMVNFLYDELFNEEHNQAYVGTGEIAFGPSIRDLMMQQASPPASKTKRTKKAASAPPTPTGS